MLRACTFESESTHIAGAFPMEQTNTFWSQFESRIAPYNLLQHPFYQAWTAGELTREDLREYASEYWHHVSAFPTYLSALHSRLPDGELRRTVLRNLADEEGMDSPDGRAHSDLWMDFVTGMGANADETTSRQLQPEVQALIATFRSLMQEQKPVAALAALYAYESRVPEIAREKACGLKAHYGADAATARYFTLHQTADVHHAQVWQHLIDTELAADPTASEAVLNVAETAAAALWNALSAVERQRQSRKLQAVN
ncbi:MAG: CADD family putative folate metabolism protein [Acidobacteriaceae bacterium]